MSTTRILKLNKDLPYIVAARKEGYWDSVMNIYPTADTSYSITMDAYDGLSAKYSESYQSADTIDFSETILPWKIQYSNLLETSKFCLMPYGGGSTETWYTYNFNVVGSPTINNTTKVVSGFGTSNYLQLQEPFNPGNSPWEVVVKFTTGSNITTWGTLLHSYAGTSNRYGIGCNIINSSFEFFVSSDGSSWLFDNTGTYTILTNTTYYVKFGWNGSEYYLEYSTDGSNYTRDITETSTNSVYNSLSITNIGIYYNSSFQYPWKASIDLSETYIKVNNTVWWQPEFTEHSRVVYQNIVEIEDKLNATFVGSPTFNTETGIVSGFSASNYVTLGNLSMASYNTWSFETEFTTGNVVNETQAIFIENNTGWNSGFNIGGTGNIHIGLSSAHSGNDIGEAYTTTTLSSNTTYKTKLEFTGTAYNFYLDDVLEATITSSTKLSNHVWNIGCTNNSGWPIAFLGSVNLKKTKFIADGVERILYKKVPVQEPNVTNLDTATNTDGVVSSITSALPMKHSVTFYKNKSFEIYTKLLTTSSVADINEIFVVPNVMLLRTWNNNWNPCFYVNGNWEQTSTGSNVYTNSTYYIRCRYFPDTTTVDGKTYTAKNVYFEKSTDNSSWTSIYNTSLTTYFFGNDASVTEREINGVWGAQGTSEIWKGSIDFNTAYIKVDGQIVWNGMTNSTISLPGCTANFTDTGDATTLNAFVINNTESVVLTPDNTYTNGWKLGTVSIPAHTAYDYDNGTWTEKS